MMFTRRSFRATVIAPVLVAVVGSCADRTRPPRTDTVHPSAAIHTLVNEFAGTGIDGHGWAPYQDPSRTTLDDRLIVTLPQSVAGYGGLISQQPYNLASSFFLAEISQSASGGPYTETVIGVTTLDEEEYVAISSLGGKIGAYHKWRGKKWRRVGEITFNPTNHRFRRIREQGGVVYYELSSNGVTWTRPTGWSITHRFSNISGLHGMVGAGAYFADAEAGTAIFEGVNTTVPAIPSGVSVTMAAAAQAQLTWQDRSVNETGFRIERRVGDGAFVEIGTVATNETQYSDPTLTAGTTYEYRVRAFNAQGSSAPSPTASVTTAPVAESLPQIGAVSSDPGKPRVGEVVSFTVSATCRRRPAHHRLAPILSPSGSLG
jgi:hypothetical protein